MSLPMVRVCGTPTATLADLRAAWQAFVRVIIISIQRRFDIRFTHIASRRNLSDGLAVVRQTFDL